MSSKKDTNNKVAKKETTAVATQGFGFVEVKESEIVREAKGRGNENVLAKDKLIPRLAIAQDNSPEVKKRDPLYIEGMEAGNLFNTVTRENYGAKVAFVPVYFRTTYIIWRKKDSGGGFLGQYDLLEQANEALPKVEKPEQCEIVETYENYGFILNGKGGQPEFVSVSMPKTKQRPARRLNSLIEFYGGDRWSYAYWFGTVTETSKVTGDDYFNYAVELAGKSMPAVKALGEHFHQQMTVVPVKTDYSNGDNKPKAESTDY